ncbi:MAG: hypothetical protein ACR2PY_00260, partial [Salinispira sp.]
MSNSEMSNSEIIIYRASDDSIRLDVHLEDETVWLNQLQMAALFNKDKRTISEHIRNIFNEEELHEEVVIRKFRTTTQHGAIAGVMQKFGNSEFLQTRLEKEQSLKEL